MQQDHTEIIETPSASRELTEEVYADGGRVRHVEQTDSSGREARSRYAAPGTNVDRYDTVAYDPYAGRRLAAYRLNQVIYWVFGLIEGLILVRLILKALGANPAAGFAQFIYSITTPLVAPFLNLFGTPSYQNSVLELSSIVAVIVYALIAWLLTRLVWILLGETRSAVHTRSTQVDSHY
jgi:uncharacterized protein YggT (Ycf19 family)